MQTKKVFLRKILELCNLNDKSVLNTINFYTFKKPPPKKTPDRNDLFNNFLNFISSWNKFLEFDTPNHHQEIGRWLEKLWQKPTDKKRGLILAFRGSGKSTIIGLFCAWVLVKNPDLRILILSAEERLAGKMSRNIKAIIQKHPQTQHLIPEKKSGSWAGKEFTVNRNKDLREPSVIAAGLTGNITGSRADIIICDDVEVPNTADTEQKRQDLRQRLDELEFIITPKGLILYIGTPHTHPSIYKC